MIHESENVYSPHDRFFLSILECDIRHFNTLTIWATRYPALEVTAKLEDKVRNNILSCTNKFSFLPSF